MPARGAGEKAKLVMLSVFNVAGAPFVGAPLNEASDHRTVNVPAAGLTPPNAGELLPPELIEYGTSTDTALADVVKTALTNVLLVMVIRESHRERMCSPFPPIIVCPFLGSVNQNCAGAATGR